MCVCSSCPKSVTPTSLALGRSLPVRPLWAPNSPRQKTETPHSGVWMHFQKVRLVPLHGGAEGPENHTLPQMGTQKARHCHRAEWVLAQEAK